MRGSGLNIRGETWWLTPPKLGVAVWICCNLGSKGTGEKKFAAEGAALFVCLPSLSAQFLLEKSITHDSRRD